jgi:hypothetical protein
MAVALANLAVVSAPWLDLPQPKGEALVREHLAAFARAPDADFETAWAAYRAASEAASAGPGSPPANTVFSVAQYLRLNDQRAYCMVLARTLKVRSLVPNAIPGVDAARNTRLEGEALAWLTARHPGAVGSRC